MKITKAMFLQVLATHLFNKLGVASYAMQDINIAVQSLIPALAIYTPKMKSNGILDDENRIDVSILETEINKFFSMIPVINLPFQNIKLSINMQDAKKFIADLKRKSDIDEVIYLPCQS